MGRPFPARVAEMNLKPAADRRRFVREYLDGIFAHDLHVKRIAGVDLDFSGSTATSEIHLTVFDELRQRRSPAWSRD